MCEISTVLPWPIDELMEAYRLDLVWHDGDWVYSAGEWHATWIHKRILEFKPGAIINGRFAGNSDYATPEQNFSVTRSATDILELRNMMNKSWSYLKRDTMYKTSYEVITTFIDAIGTGDNLLLNIGTVENNTS